jgi:hypothetical protein
MNCRQLSRGRLAFAIAWLLAISVGCVTERQPSSSPPSPTEDAPNPRDATAVPKQPLLDEMRPSRREPTQPTVPPMRSIGTGDGGSSGGTAGSGVGRGGGGGGGGGGSRGSSRAHAGSESSKPSVRQGGHASEGKGSKSQGSDASGSVDGQKPGSPVGSDAAAASPSEHPDDENPLKWLGVGTGTAGRPEGTSDHSPDRDDEPTLPDLPEGTTPVPSRAESAEAIPLSLSMLRGGWLQVADGTLPNHADYAPGGYAARLLVIRDLDSLMRVTCSFGYKGETRVTGSLSLRLDPSGSIHIGPPRAGGPAFSMLPKGAYRPTQEAIDVPIRMEGDSLRLGDKRFRRANEAEVRGFVAGSDLHEDPRKPSGPALLGEPMGDEPTLLIVLPPANASEFWTSACRSLRGTLAAAPGNARICILAPGSEPGAGYRWSQTTDRAALLGIGLAEANTGIPIDARQVAAAITVLQPPPGRVLVVTATDRIPRNLQELLSEARLRCAIRARLLPGATRETWMAILGGDGVAEARIP